MPRGKRKRALSDCHAANDHPTAADPPVPLTAANLAHLEAMSAPAPSGTRKTAASRSSAGNSGASASRSGRGARGGGSGGTSRRSGSVGGGSASASGSDLGRLASYSIEIDVGQIPLPAGLQRLVDTLQNASYAPPSPNAAKVAALSGAAFERSEVDGIALLEDLLIGKDAIKGWGGMGMDMIRLCKDTNLDRAYLPEAEGHIAGDVLPPLEQAQPDTLLGYIHRGEAQTVGLPSPLTAKEELHSRSFAISPAAHYPFLTFQWKSPKNKGTHYQARSQCARDGSAIVQYLHHFYTSAEDAEPGPEDTCHFSGACDMQSVYIYVHWRHVTDEGTVQLRMRRILTAFCFESDQVRVIRRFIRNLTSHAQGPRLVRIKAALSALASKLEQGAAAMSRPKTISQACSGSSSVTTVAMPATPADSHQPSLPPSQGHKRARLEEPSQAEDEVSFGAFDTLPT